MRDGKNDAVFGGVPSSVECRGLEAVTREPLCDGEAGRGSVLAWAFGGAVRECGHFVRQLILVLALAVNQRDCQQRSTQPQGSVGTWKS